MKFLVTIALIALISFVIGLWLDWWSIGIAAFLVTVFIRQSPVKSFLSGFIALFLLWGGMAWWIDMQNEQVLSHKIAALLPFGGSSFLMILVTAMIGALVAGFAALAGSFLLVNNNGKQ